MGRGKKKALLAHIINENNWSQVLVFTRTKFGANNVAEYLEKNGITAMALHGNKSQAARTQALSGFKSGDVRALVATDIAARGIDIDDLPHVVNYEIPNISEDYVHRIGRTGRAGADGTAVNFVCLDEEGFMQDIERFTKQKIEVKVIDGFGPEPDEKAEPIAMGRQTIWGGAGKPPSRDVMQAAAKAARSEMMQRIRDNKAKTGGNGGGRNGAGQRQSPRPAGPTEDGVVQLHDGARGNGNGGGQGRRNPNPGNNRPRQERGERGEPSLAREDLHLGSGFGLNRNKPRPQGGGQPDPMRTSVDMMSDRGGRRGGGGFGGGQRRGGGGEFAGGGGYGNGKPGGAGRGGNRPRGPGNPRNPAGR